MKAKSRIGQTTQSKQRQFPERSVLSRVLGRSAGPPRRQPGSVIGAPDFVGVGAQRAGTNWWFKLLRDHPQVETAAGKEQHFFDRFLGRDFTEDDMLDYYSLFPRSPGVITGEWTPRYMHDFWTPSLLHRAAPEAKILVLLRDPWERYRSGLGHEARALEDELRRRDRQRRKDRQHVRTLIANDALDRSLYWRQLSRLLEHFERSRLLVLQYERCVEDPAHELRRTYEFLGLDQANHLPAFLRDRASRSSPRSFVPDHIERAATKAMARDAARLKDFLPEIDLDLWPSCRGT